MCDTDQGSTIIQTQSVDKDGNTEIQYIQTTSLGAEDVVVTETPQPSQQHVLTASELSQLGSQDMVALSSGGELDPHTGVYYATSSGETGSGRGGLSRSKAEHTGPEQQVSSRQQQQDFLSSALTQAQIDLDPYQFIEEDEASFSVKAASSQPPGEVGSSGLVSILSPSVSSSAGGATTVLTTQQQHTSRSTLL